MNIFPELSDDNTGRHFGMIWAQQGQNFIVIPLTKHSQTANRLSAELGIIPNMPNGVIIYAKIDTIRSVSIRRLYKIIHKLNNCCFSATFFLFLYCSHGYPLN